MLLTVAGAGRVVPDPVEVLRHPGVYPGVAYPCTTVAPGHDTSKLTKKSNLIGKYFHCPWNIFWHRATLIKSECFFLTYLLIHKLRFHSALLKALRCLPEIYKDQFSIFYVHCYVSARHRVVSIQNVGVVKEDSWNKGNRCTAIVTIMQIPPRYFAWGPLPAMGSLRAV